MSIHLSKSKYCQAVQCPKMLWLNKNKPDAFDDGVMNMAVIETGNEVGDLAMGLFGAYKEIPFKPDDFASMLHETKKLIRQGTPIITEATFSFQGLLCMVDILKNLGNNTVEIYEVKSSTGMKDIYYDDASYQRYVLTMAGYNVNRVCLVHLNNEYVRHGALDITELFHVEDITEKASAAHDTVAANISRFDAYMKNTTEPSDDIGEHCFSPYSCGFFGYCTRHLPTPNVFDIAGMLKKTKFKNYYNGVCSFQDLQDKGRLNAAQTLQIDAELSDISHIDKKAISEFLATLSYPLYFLDFETFNPAIPPYDGLSPYEKIVFQYSLHYIETEDGTLKHKEFLAEPGKDPRRPLAEQLCQDIPLNVCTTAYNRGFEKGVISKLAEAFPDLKDHLMNIHSNIRDIMIPFQKKHYYVKEMKGSYSIKYVLPALFPNDPSLDYSNLEDVHNGNDASATFARMASMSLQDQQKARNNLLKYCGLDTLAMVKVWEKLREKANTP